MSTEFVSEYCSLELLLMSRPAYYALKIDSKSPPIEVHISKYYDYIFLGVILIIRQYVIHSELRVITDVS